jgi:hypothetical protein
MGTNILKIPAHGAVEVRLADDPSKGVAKPSQFREVEYLHYVNDGQMVYLDPAAHQALFDLGAAQGDTVRLTKMRRGKESYIDVALVTDTPVATWQPAPQPAATLRAELKAAAPVVNFLAPAPVEVGCHMATPATPPIPTAPVEDEFPTLHRPAAKELAAALCAAIDAAKYAEAYARKIGYAMAPFSTEEISKLGIHLNINAGLPRGNRGNR